MFVGSWKYVSMILRGNVCIIPWGKKQSICDFAEQRTMGPWFCGTKSALLHDFAGQSPHCSITLRGKDKVLRAKTQLNWLEYYKKH